MAKSYWTIWSYEIFAAKILKTRGMGRKKVDNFKKPKSWFVGYFELKLTIGEIWIIRINVCLDSMSFNNNGLMSFIVGNALRLYQPNSQAWDLNWKKQIYQLNIITLKGQFQQDLVVLENPVDVLV